jgi:hypothetical protein
MASPRLKSRSFSYLVLLLGIWPSILRAEEKPRVEIWLIDSRCAPVSCDWESGKERLSFWRLGENRQWDASDAATFFAGGDKNKPTVFLVHGNRTTNDEAVEFAWPISCWIGDHCGEKSYRVVVWSWPSTQLMKRLRPDVQIKASFCDSQSYYLADCLLRMKSEEPVSLIGYSFGARIIAGGLHFLGGGNLDGQSLPAAKDNVQKREGPLRAFFVAAAFDCHAFAPGQKFDKAIGQAQEMLVTQNQCDDALRWYPRLYGRGGPDALGFAGPCCVNASNLHIFNAACCVGKSHHWESYIYCPALFRVLPHYLYLGE